MSENFVVEMIIVSFFIIIGIGLPACLVILYIKQFNKIKQSQESKTTHHLKCWPISFQSMKNAHKTFEYRKNDRNYQIGDILHQKEWNEITSQYTGDELYQKVTYILHGGQFGIPEDYCIMSVVPI